KKAAALKLARSLPHARESREIVLPNFLEKEEKDAYLRENLPGILSSICAIIDENIAPNDEKLYTVISGKYRSPLPAADAIRIIAGFLG
ncbi:MAG: hypothetical protein FWF08_00860, partial [Oscillospiraceae bacterium]|nr:hypothetical protein [Oscillospiraceae bacterium]